MFLDIAFSVLISIIFILARISTEINVSHKQKNQVSWRAMRVISKELFCKTIADIQEQDERINRFGDALNKICDTSVVFDVNNLYLTALLRILKEELNDRADIIQWWLYEDVRKCIWYDFQDGRRMRYDMPTAETLYDYLSIRTASSRCRCRR